MTLADISEIVKDLSVVFAAGMAVFGIRSWQREFVGKRRIELAEETLSLFYQARDAIAEMRHPWSSSLEGRTRKSGPNETPAMKEQLDQAYVLAERYNAQTELFSKIRALRFRFMAIVGQHSIAPFELLNQVQGKILGAVNTRMWSIQQGSMEHLPKAVQKQRIERMHKTDEIYWSMGDDSDPLAALIKQMIQEIEGICRPMIERPSVLQRWFSRKKVTATAPLLESDDE
jgi:hypothetical protein